MIDIFKIQIGNYVGKEPFWMVAAVIQAGIILKGLPHVVRNLWPYIIDCTIPDKDANGELTSLQINYAADSKCVFLPGELIMTNT
jgi:hypothetical protein